MRFSARVLCVDWVVQAVGIGVDAAFEERALVVWADESHQAWDEYSVPVSECVTVQRRNVKFTIEPHCSGRLRVGVSKPIGCVVCWLACCWGRGCSCGAMLVTGLAFQTGCNGRIVFLRGVEVLCVDIYLTPSDLALGISDYPLAIRAVSTSFRCQACRLQRKVSSCSPARSFTARDQGGHSDEVPKAQANF